MVTDSGYTCHGEHWEMYRIVESLFYMPETNIMLYVVL